MNKKYFAFYLFFSLAVSGCGGGGGSDDPFGALPNVNPVPELTGSWDLTMTTENTTCSLLFPVGTVSYETISIFDNGSCQLTTADFDDTDQSTSTIKCQAGGEQAVVQREMIYSDPSCTGTAKHKIFLQVDNSSGSDALTGSFEQSFAVSENCGLNISACTISGVITAEYAGSTDSIETQNPDLNPTDIDSDDVPNSVDNCPVIANPDQADWNKNNKGNACDVEECSADGTCLRMCETISDCLPEHYVCLGGPGTLGERPQGYGYCATKAQAEAFIEAIYEGINL